MNALNFMKNVNFKDAFHGFGLKVAAARPEIMLISGGISVLVGTIYACTKTEQAKKELKEHKETIKKIDETLKLPESDEENGITVLPETVKQMKIERGRQYSKEYLRLTWQFLKIYGVPALLWFGGMGMICGGHYDLRLKNRHLAADIVAGNQLLKEYRSRVADAVGEEIEQKIYMGTQEDTVNVLEKDEKTGEEKIVKKKADIFYAQPGSIFARNFTNETSDAFDIRSFAEHYLDARINEINQKLETGWFRAFNAIDILRMLGFNENALTERVDDDETMQKMLMYGISGNARKVPDPEMRKLKVTKLRGYKKVWDVARNMEVYEPCMRLDFNFYPLEGKI